MTCGCVGPRGGSVPALQGGHVVSRSPVGLRQEQARARPWMGGGFLAFLRGPDPVAHASGCRALGASRQWCPSWGAAPLGDRRTGVPLCVLGGTFSLLLPVVRGPGESSALSWPPPTFARLGLAWTLSPAGAGAAGLVSVGGALGVPPHPASCPRATDGQTLRTTLGEGRGVCHGGCDDKG